MKARRIMLGIGLLALAGGLVGRKMGIIPSIPISRLRSAVQLASMSRSHSPP